MRKLLFIFVPIILAVAIFAVIFLLITRNSATGALQVTSAPISKVYIDGKLIGQTPLCKCQQNDMISSGSHDLRLVPTEGNFDPFEEKITVTPSVLTVVDRTFGPGASSQGSIISLSPIQDKKSAQLLVISFPDNAAVSLDSNPSGKTPLLLQNVTPSDHDIKVTKDGYKDKSIRIRTVSGYKLEVLVYLGVNLTTATASALPTATPSASPSPTASVTITILDTPTGFLRVRSAPSLGGSEIGQVKPGDKFQLLNEQSGWYQIKIQSGQTGWVSSQYAQKSS
jgi:Bacterial SH3 domain/PEGA domain